MIKQIGNATLYLGDCQEILPTLGHFDAVITDPPYGINRDGKLKSTSSHGGTKHYEFLGWDKKRPNREIFNLILKVSNKSIICGGNYFADLLPPTMRWLVWDKGQRIDQADGELAWTSENKALRIMTLNRVQLMKDGAEHPTQKPVYLMEWCISLLDNSNTICDPFMGSGTTGVACAKMGKTFVGIEKEQKYFDIACQRIEQAYAQADMFLNV